MSAGDQRRLTSLVVRYRRSPGHEPHGLFAWPRMDAASSQLSRFVGSASRTDSMCVHGLLRERPCGRRGQARPRYRACLCRFHDTPGRRQSWCRSRLRPATLVSDRRSLRWRLRTCPGALALKTSSPHQARSLALRLDTPDRTTKLIPTAMTYKWVCAFARNRAPAPHNLAGRTGLVGASTRHLVDVRCTDGNNAPSIRYRRPRLSTAASDGTRNP